MKAQYATAKWSEAKAEFLAAVKAAIAAKNVAMEKIRRECGQSLEVYHILPEVGLKFYTTSPYSHCAYWRIATLRGIWPLSPLEVPSHWDVTMSQLREEIAWLAEWSTPEVWEAAWAKVQK